ncbi:hypothetical protein [Devosia sp.]|uniref:hypothetical protein n=1 Tax=Devosia sp. TaxID=1871048 RepID=UPI003A8CF36A
MPTAKPIVALLAANAAFAAILGRTLREEGGFRVEVFATVMAMTRFIASHGTAIAVIDCDLPRLDVRELSHSLRTVARTSLRQIAVTRAAPAFHAPLRAAGIDVVLQKPVTPDQMLTCVRTLHPTGLAGGGTQDGTEHRFDADERHPDGQRDNVIELFRRTAG